MKRTRLMVLPVVVALAAVGLGGCSDSDPSARLLEGTWKLETTSAADDSVTYLVFDDEGDLQRVVTDFEGGQIETTIIAGEADIIGDSVRIRSTLLTGQVIFEGEFNSSFDVIEGETTIRIALGVATIRLDGEEATLTRIDDDEIDF
ncbi:MAG: hypothetical protein SF069_09345 [Phycisphaerae bacterium]|nr:hypothetical protein [Phycisphaerae bacterium]